MEEKGEIILYQPDEAVKLEVRLEDETVWLSQGQMAELFDVKENTITYHIKEIYNVGELEVNSTTRKIRVVRKEGNRNVSRNIDFYNLDMIISVGYRVSSKRGVRFRQWATGILKDYMLKGYSISQRMSTWKTRWILSLLPMIVNWKSWPARSTFSSGLHCLRWKVSFLMGRSLMLMYLLLT